MWVYVERARVGERPEYACNRERVGASGKNNQKQTSAGGVNVTPLPHENANRGENKKKNARKRRAGECSTSCYMSEWKCLYP